MFLFSLGMENGLKKYATNKQSYPKISDHLLKNLQKNEKDIEEQFDLLMTCRTAAQDKEGIEKLKLMHKKLNIVLEKHRTKTNYLKLLNILKDNSVKIVLMQYPLKNINRLKNMVHSAENYDQVLFIANQENFQESLINHSYNEIFTDRAAGSFGHGTQKGNRLIAESVAVRIIGGP